LFSKHTSGKCIDSFTTLEKLEKGRKEERKKERKKERT
jgi:hypothetical protein